MCKEIPSSSWIGAQNEEGTQNYGFVGKEFIEYLQQPENLEHAKELQQSFYAELLKGSSTEKQAASASAILAADTIATELFFQDGSGLSLEEVSSVMTSRAEVDVNRRALQYIFDLIAANPNRFDPNSFGEIWGKRDRYNTCLYIIKSIFDRELLSKGFNPDVFLIWADKQDIIERGDHNHRTKGVNIKGTTVRAVCIKQSEAWHLLDPDCPSGFTPLYDDVDI